MGHSDHRRARAEHQRMRIIRLLEELADADEKKQCRKCGEWFDPQGVANHETTCEGP